MAQNEIPRAVDALIALGDDAADGAAQYEVAIGLKQNLETKIRAEVQDLTGVSAQGGNPAILGKQALYAQAKSAKTLATSVKQVADSNARAFIAAAINALKPVLGNQWSSAWEAVGFNNDRLAIPAREDDRFSLVNAIRNYLVQRRRKSRSWG